MKTRLLWIELLLAAAVSLAACTVTAAEPASGPIETLTPTATAAAAEPTATPEAPPTDAPPASATVTHDGISLTYSPALLGTHAIQDVPATANQGMFDQPSPDHTWIGFVPTGVEPDVANHWMLSRQPQVIVFDLNDFGSFAPADARARAIVAAFEALVPQRPLSFDSEIPVLPPVNAAQTIRAQVKWLDFGGGSGVRFVTTLSQDTLPVTNDHLMVVFSGTTHDGLHGVTAVFPVTAAGIPDTVQLSDTELAALRQNYAAEMAAVTEQINALPDSAFDPPLSQLDALLESIVVTPGAEDYAVIPGEPRHGRITAAAEIFSAPNGYDTIGTLATGDPIVVNGVDSNFRRHRILCADGTTGNCWVAGDRVEILSEVDPVLATAGMPNEGAVVQITAVSNNPIFAAPDGAPPPIGLLLAGESAEVFAPDATGNWLHIACPRSIGTVCWVVADTAVNRPSDFFGGDGWQGVAGRFVSFRVPSDWQPTAVGSGGGAVLEAWHLGVPGVETDQDIAFFSIPFEALMPNDLIETIPFEIGGQPGKKWVRSGTGYVSYDYYTAGTAATQAAGAGSFGIHITVPRADPELEALMDMLAASVIFGE